MNHASEIWKLAQAQRTRVSEIRKQIHRHPELGFDLPRTQKIVMDELARLQIPCRSAAQSGVIAELNVGAATTIALRADMDALPMTEQTTHDFKSEIPGRAHMCGHDSHVAMLLGAAHVLAQLKSQLKMNVRFLFQPSEEQIPGGAPAMIKEGALSGVSEVFGLHVWPLVATGQFGVISGPLMAQPDEFTITITGHGGHGALPHLCIDPIYVGAELVVQLQSIVSRSVNPLEQAVLSVTQFHGGSTHNVIPESCTLNGTIRTFRPDIQKMVRQKLQATLDACATRHGVKIHLQYDEGYPPTINHSRPTGHVESVVQSLFGDTAIDRQAQPVMGGEDFAYYGQVVPAHFTFLGIRNESKGTTRMCHDPRFDIDEDALPYGIALHAGICLTRS